MCGIVGSIHTKFNLGQALSKIKHRGPDADGIYENNEVQFGHARLSIIDLTNGSNQPFVNEATGSVLVFNGEIYNYKELKSEMESQYTFQTTSDTEVLFYGLQKFGISFVSRLQGMFAFAYYDGVHQVSYLVRDRLGIKPLYYRKVDNGYLFASEIKAIQNENFNEQQINQKRLADFIYHRRLDHTTETFYNGIYQLPAGTYLKFDHKELEAEQVSYYELPCMGSGKQNLDVIELKEKIYATVQSHLQADVPVGSFLSGGVDSSIISHVMSVLVADKVSTLSGRTVYDHAENKLIDTFLEEHPNVHSIQFQLDGSQFFEEIFNVIHHHDEPILDGSMFSHYMLCKKASQNGIKVVLSGSGGDEVFGGYESHSIASLTDHIRTLKFKPFFTKIRRYCSFHHQNKARVVSKIIAELLGQKVKEAFKNLRKQKSILVLDPNPVLFKSSCQTYTANAFERSLKYQTVPPYLHYEDRNSMAFGVEIRVPFLDHQLIEYVSQINSDDFFNGQTKSALRKAFASEISGKIIWQAKKEGFPSPIDTALKSDTRIKAFFYNNLASTPFLNTEECKNLANKFYENGTQLTLFWRLLSYMIWYHIQLEKNV
jgi:asparagine synthase (glutamine-hydrolysing)